MSPNPRQSDPVPVTPAPLDSASRILPGSDFRDHLSTANRLGQRLWIFAKQPVGPWTDRRTWFSWLLIAIMFVGPFVRINGNPLLMINIIERRFSILGQLFWPQDAILLAVALLIAVIGIILFTTAFGRLWCGWACPQTVLMEMVFRKIEFLIDGNNVEQRRLAAAPWNSSKVLRRALKLGIFFALSFLICNTLLAYIIGSDALFQIITDNPRRHLVGLGFMVAFTLVFFAIFARFREQACTFICPYGRFQSTMIDENTMIVAYDHRRGEKRARRPRSAVPTPTAETKNGDCIDCLQCVAVCPTGIDIRNGMQMECVHCTACMDACDNVMKKINRPSGLIRYASLNSIERQVPFRFSPRMALYTGVLTALLIVFLTLIFTRPAVEAVLLRAPGSLFMQTADGRIENLYTLKLINKTMRDLPVELKLENVPGTLEVMGSTDLRVAPGQLAETSVLIQLDPAALTDLTIKLNVGVYAEGKKLQTVKTDFIGPRRTP